jgi:hypothetical protein
LYPRRVGRKAHQPPKGIDLARNLTLRKSSDGWITAHRRYSVPADCYKAGFCPDPRRRVRSLSTGMTCTYYNAIKIVCIRSARHIYAIQNLV